MSLRNAMRSTLIALLAVVTALPFLVSPAQAAPSNQVRAQVSKDANSVKVEVFGGTVGTEHGNLVVRDKSGKVLEQYGLNFIAPDNRTYPIDASVKGNTATLVPSKDVKRSVKTDAALLEKTNVADKNGFANKQARDDAALSRLNSELAAGGTISALIGTAIGAVIGGVFAATICGATLLPAVILCIPTGAAVGGIIGTVVIGGPSAIVSLTRFFDTVNAPFVNVPAKR